MNIIKNKKISKTAFFVLFVLILLALVTTISVYSNTVALAELKKTENELHSSIQNELKEKEDLEKSQKYYESDEYVEKIAREQLGFVKPNEIVYIIK